MRLLPTFSSILLLLLHNANLQVSANTSGGGGLYPPGLLPIISRADVLLSTGQFGDAAKVYSEAIEQSPNDYLLYYKRATSHLSLQRHLLALEDFDKVLSLTSQTFDNAHLQKARIFLKEGNFSSAQSSLALYLKAKKGSGGGKKGSSAETDAEVVRELEQDVREGERLRAKAEGERGAQLWTACVESATGALRLASHSVEIRSWRAECALASGDVESAVGDLSRLSHLLQSSTTLLTHIFRLTYFLTPHTPTESPTHLTPLKQCLHYDPDSKPCLALHRLAKSLDKGFAALEGLLAKEDWKGVVKLLEGPGGGRNGEVFRRWEEAMGEGVRAENVVPLVPPELLQAHMNLHAGSSTPQPTTTTTKGTTDKKSKAGKQQQQQGAFPPIPLPDAQKASPQRQHLVRALCNAYTHLAALHTSNPTYLAQTTHYCTLLLSLDNCADDVQGLLGKATVLEAQEEWEEAVRVLERAFEQGGRADREVAGRVREVKERLRRSRMKDYYKVLGVGRDADAKTVKRAFRKAAKLAHPDKGGSEAKMAALNEAYEVISNPELRARFDAGEDPMDPQSAANGGGGGAGGAWGGGDPFAQFFGGRQGGHGPFSGGNTGGFQFHYSHGH